MSTQIIKVPDIGADSAELIEILVSVGEQIDVEQSLVTLESDKASLEVPSPVAGTVVSVLASVNDQLSEGMDLLEIEVAEVATEESETDVQEPVVSEPVQESAPIAAVETEQRFQVPDIGSDQAEVIEIAVAVGDSVEEGDTLIVLETDKASVDVPAEVSGTVVAIHTAEGAQIQPGEDLATLKVVSAGTESSSAVIEQADSVVLDNDASASSASANDILANITSVSAEPEPRVSLVPDMGADTAKIIELSVQVGDHVEEGDTLVVVETDKASVDVPAEFSGEVAEVHASVDSEICQGDQLVTILAEVATPIAVESAPAEIVASSTSTPAVSESKPVATAAPAASGAGQSAQVASPSAKVHAGPSVRKLARQLGVNLAFVLPTGQRNRIIKEDVHKFVKQKLSSSNSSSSSAGAGIPEIPATDWAQFGATEVQSMSRIGKVTAQNMVRNWLNVPHVTQFDSADVTELETYRGYLKAEAAARGIKMTPLAFLLRASAIALSENPKFNTALQGDDLVERKFFHVSIAVDTPLGLMVPVIRDVDKKDIWQLASEVSSLAQKAKNGKLSPKEMQGASFTISSLGAIGGTGFTPIVPSPQVGILGVSKTAIQPVWDGSTFVPRKMMPLALSYDHRVVNGADAGKFMTCLVEVLSDLNRIWNG